MDHIPRDPMVAHRCQAPGTPGTGTGAPSEAGKELWGRRHWRAESGVIMKIVGSLLSMMMMMIIIIILIIII
jgi:hypothetical protein